MEEIENKICLEYLLLCAQLRNEQTQVTQQSCYSQIEAAPQQAAAEQKKQK